MKKGIDIFAVSLVIYWIAIFLGSSFPIKNNPDNIAILALLGITLAIIFGLLGDKDKLW